ncbi:MAG: ABC transporter permease [Mangrovibacterium sp.]
MWKRLKTGIAMTGSCYRRELEAILKDPGAMLILFGALIIYPITYAFAYKNELIREICTTVVDLDNSPASRKLVRMLEATEQLAVSGQANSMEQARQLFYAGNQGGIICIPKDFERNLLAGRQANVSVYADGSFFLIYRQVINGAVSATGIFSAGVEINRLTAEGKSPELAMKARDPLAADLHFWFNPSSGYGTFLMPGMILIILQQTLLIGIGMMGGTRREKAQHNEPVPVALRRGSIFPVLFGRTFSYLSIYFINCLITLVWVYSWFGYPRQTSLLPVFMLILPFLLSVIFLGISLSVLFRRREESMLFLIFLSPVVFFLSGISWPASSVPDVAYALAHLIPSTLVVPAYLRLRIMGAGLTDIRPEFMMLLLQCTVYFFTAMLAIYYEAWHANKKRN